ncbi:MAG: type III-B CRISPR module-associated protein Cmr5 [Calditrichaeota bacterium]|nr:MAG: type III-B CRISPR module-associated protein Cmr5 [Calditrichota bacterium]
MTNLEQQRAYRAFQKTGEISAGDKKDFLGLAQRLPAMLQNNGLLATWAFLLTKNEGVFPKMLDVLKNHLREMGFENEVTDNAPKAIFQNWTDPHMGLNGTKLMQLTAESIAFSGWMKRAAEAICEV